MTRGYVKLWRKILDSGLLRNPTAWQVYGYLLMNAAHKDMKTFSGATQITLKAGQVLTGRKKIASECNISERNVRTALQVLKNLEIVTIETSNKYSVVSFINWDTYQQDRPAERPTNCPTSDQQVTSSRPTNDQQTTTKQELKNLSIKEIRTPLTPQGEGGARSSEAVSGSKAGKPTAPTIAQQIAQYTQDVRLGGALAAYVEMRKKIKKPLTEHAMTLALKKLDELGGVDVEYKAKVVEQSVLNSWQGLFEIKGEEPRSAAEIREEEEEERRFEMEQDKFRCIAHIIKRDFGETNQFDLSDAATRRKRELLVMTNEQLHRLCA